MERFYIACDGFVRRKIAGADVLISIGGRVADFNGYITLNENCAFLWDHLQMPQTPEHLAKLLFEEYEVSYEQALQDIEQWLQTMLNQGMIREAVQ